MSEEMMYELEEALEGFGSVAAANSVTSLFTLATYVLAAIALFTMAKRRGIHHAWLSWIPVGNNWILGSLADQYRYVSRREVKNKRKALLTLSIIQMVIGFIMAGVTIGGIVGAFHGAMNHYSDDQMFEAVFGPLMGVLVLCLPLSGIAIAQVVVRFMALYDVYQSCAPENATMFLVLSIFFRITEPFFLFFNREKDTGMVQKSQTVYQTPSYVSTPENGGSWSEPQQNPPAYEQPQQIQQNPQGSAEPWTQKPEHQDPWDQGPEKL